MMPLNFRIPIVFTFCFFINLSLVTAQSKEDRIDISDRSEFIEESTNLSPDPRRVPWPSENYGPKDSIAILGARVFDGTQNPIEEKDVLIFRNKIARVGKAGTIDIPDGITTFQFDGKTLMPGLIDLHTHITYANPNQSFSEEIDLADATLRAVERMRYYLESGITSIRDVASAGNVPFTLKKWVRQRRLRGPRIFPAGTLITAPGGHGAEAPSLYMKFQNSITEASGPVEWRKAVRENFRKGADIIKVASHFSKEEIKAAVEEAHALGLQVTCDCETFYIEWAIEAGVDIIEHPLPRTGEVIEMMAERDVASVPTLIPYDYIFDMYGGYWGSTSRRFSFSKEDNIELLRKMREADIQIGVGTDLVSDWYQYLPDAYISELKKYLNAGFSRKEALIAATKVSAEILDMDHMLGTLEEGKFADLIVIDGKPEENLDDLANILMVIRDGEVVVREGKVDIPRHKPKPEPESAE